MYGATPPNKTKIGVILNKFFQNPNIWHVKVPLVNYATIETHQTDRVLRQFGFRQLIPVAPEEYIKIWEIGMIIYLLENRSSFQKNDRAL
ncbi:hypothetical protein Gotri_025176 [Gossypium trilobum]|uniref:Uncharacterized protein n=1 Tax=Gossypium trilobum TaxID=34281 RepID=A0A7J9FIZ3_9ROSI|nr:hypothetical protein [Gossypium trilobum]